MVKPFNTNVIFFSGSAAASVRRRGCDENVRQSQDQRQPAHISAQQEILQEVNRVTRLGSLCYHQYYFNTVFDFKMPQYGPQ